MLKNLYKNFIKRKIIIMESEFKDLNIEKKLKLNDSFISESKNSNFRKSVIQLPNGTVELGISFYSNMLFVIINSNGKLGNIWIGELEQESDDHEENFSDIRCILGNRKDQISQFLSDTIINFIFNEIKINKNDSKFNNIKKIMLSLALKYQNLFENDFKPSDQDELLYTNDFKKFVSELKKNLSELL